MGISLRWKSACRWRWRCRTADGSVRAHSAQAFPSLHAAIEDAMHNGFSYAMRNSRSQKNAAALLARHAFASRRITRTTGRMSGRQLISFCAHQSFSIDPNVIVGHDAPRQRNTNSRRATRDTALGDTSDLGFPAALRRELDLAVCRPAPRHRKQAQFCSARRMHRGRDTPWLRRDVAVNARAYCAHRAGAAGA